MNLATRRRAVVLGAGASGKAAAKLLHHQGYEIILADERANTAENKPWSLTATLTGEIVSATDLAVVSPGFAVDHPWMKQLRAAGVRVVPEFELGISAMPGVRVVAITGSNGKSSVVKWIADTLSASGINAVPAGNYGLPPCEIAASGKHPDVIVLELSSFQLEQSVAFRSEIGILLNFAPNHLDRHGTMETYAHAKARIFSFMQRGDKAIIHDQAFRQFRSRIPASASTIVFGNSNDAEYKSDKSVILRQNKPVVDLSSTWWGRTPLIINAAAAQAVFDHFGIPVASVRASAESFCPLPHRMELVKEWRGIKFINDSKASTMTALAAAVAAGTEKKHLIAGGILKESDVSFVKEILAKHCAGVYCIGLAAPTLVEAWGNVVPCENVVHIEAALRRAIERAEAGHVVILSPGCSSFDQFTSYAQRGDKFKQWVQQCTQ